MTENVRKIFDILGVEPNEEFEVMLKDNSKLGNKFKFDEKLQGYCFSGEWCLLEDLLKLLLNGAYKIIKLPKEPKKKKLRDLTTEEWNKWKDGNCPYAKCGECIFRYVSCINSYNEESWIHHKDLYSDKVLNQEIEVEE